MGTPRPGPVHLSQHVLCVGDGAKMVLGVFVASLGECREYLQRRRVVAAIVGGNAKLQFVCLRAMPERVGGTDIGDDQENGANR